MRFICQASALLAAVLGALETWINQGSCSAAQCGWGMLRGSKTVVRAYLEVVGPGETVSGSSITTSPGSGGAAPAVPSICRFNVLHAPALLLIAFKGPYERRTGHVESLLTAMCVMACWRCLQSLGPCSDCRPLMARESRRSGYDLFVSACLCKSAWEPAQKVAERLPAVTGVPPGAQIWGDYDIYALLCSVKGLDIAQKLLLKGTSRRNTIKGCSCPSDVSLESPRPQSTVCVCRGKTNNTSVKQQRSCTQAGRNAIRPTGASEA